MGWNEIPAENGSSSNSQAGYLKIDREVRVRVIGEPEVYSKHFLRVNGKGVTIKCPGRDQCLVCQKGKQDEAAKVRAMFIVLDRYDDQLKLYDAPRSVATYIKALMTNPEWGSLDGYDVIIKKISGKRVDYQVQPTPKSMLSPEVVKYINETYPTINLAQVVRPHTPDEIVAILNGQPASSGRPQGSGYAPSQPQSYTPAAVPPVQAAYVSPVQPATPVAPVQPQVHSGSVGQVYPVQPVTPVQPQTPGAKADKFFNQFG